MSKYSTTVLSHTQHLHNEFLITSNMASTHHFKFTQHFHCIDCLWCLAADLKANERRQLLMRQDRYKHTDLHWGNTLWQHDRNALLIKRTVWARITFIYFNGANAYAFPKRISQSDARYRYSNWLHHYEATTILLLMKQYVLMYPLRNLLSSKMKKWHKFKRRYGQETICYT